MCKYECKNCGNSDASEFRSVSDCGVSIYNGDKYFYFEHLCNKCSYPMYVLVDSSFNKRFQASESDFTIVKPRREKVAATEFNDED